MSKPNKIVCINTKENKTLAFDRMMNGVNLLANCVRLTLGPYGRNIMIGKGGGSITNDGVTVGDQIQAKDEVEDLALRLVREATRKTNDTAGDGTTTATTFVQAILQKCSNFMARGTNFSRKSVIALKNQINTECKEIVGKLHALATPIETEEQLIAVARVSVEDEELARLIGSTQWDLGKLGMIIPEANTEPTHEVERIKGIRIDNGLGTSIVMNDPEKKRLYVKNVPVLLTNYVLQTIPESIFAAIESLVQTGHNEIVLVARGYSSEVIRILVDNANKPGGVKIFPMQAPYINQREIMYDMEAMLGGRFIFDEGAQLDSVTKEDFGFASIVIGEMYTAQFVGVNDAATEERIVKRVQKLKEELKGEPSKFNKKQLELRIAQMENGFALLKIGSISDTERKYILDKVEDAVNAVRNAFQEGTVPGAGLAFKTISEGMPEGSILKKPLCAPYNQIMENAGEIFEVESWVRNPLKVDRVAFENACRVASTLVTVGGVIVTENPKPLDTLLRNNNTQNNEEEN